MSNDIDRAFERFVALKSDLVAALAEPVNEADTRFKVVDRILLEILDWKYDSIRTEPPTPTGYIDYLLQFDPSRNVFVIEAKHSGGLVPGGSANGTADLSLSGKVLQPLREPIKQALGYAAAEGVPFAAVTDGSCWLFFKASRTDGKKPMEGKGILFRGFDAIEQDFSRFYELLSANAINERRNLHHLSRAEGLSPADAEIQFYASEPSRAKMLPRQSLGSDASLIFEKFFDRMTDDSNEEMLAECFVESSESRKADAEFVKITENLINTIVSIDTSESSALQKEVERTISTQQSEVVLLVGNKGAGKTTFTKRFFKAVLTPALRAQCAVVRIDLEGYHNVQRKIDLSVWLLREVRDRLEAAVFARKTPTANDLQGVFWDELNRWKEAQKALFKSDANEFRIRFDQHIEKLRQSEVDTYIKLLLRRSAVANKKLPCIIFDNTDQFSSAIQDHIYQFAHALSVQSPSFIMVPITDRTIWRLDKSGALQSYRANSFYLPVPDAKDELAKRISFIHARLNAEPEAAKEYFARKGFFRVSTHDLSLITDAIESVLVQQEFVSGLIGRLGNFDIRRMLQLARRIFVSPEMKIDELIKARYSGRPDRFRTYRALIKGEYDRFTEKSNDFVMNLFRTLPQNPVSPLLAFYILWLLRSYSAASSDDRHVSIESICNIFEACGTSFDGTLEVLQRLHLHGLIEELDPNVKKLGMSHTVAIKDAGIGHLDLVQGSETYLEQMALATGLNERNVRDYMIAQLKPIGPQSFPNIKHSFIQYVLRCDYVRMKIPSAAEYRILREAKDRFEQLA